jgi:hypothetical protein
MAKRIIEEIERALWIIACGVLKFGFLFCIEEF